MFTWAEFSYIASSLFRWQNAVERDQRTLWILRQVGMARARCFNYGVGNPLPSRLRGLLHVSQLPPRLQSLEKRTFNGKFNWKLIPHLVIRRPPQQRRQSLQAAEDSNSRHLYTIRATFRTRRLKIILCSTYAEAGGHCHCIVWSSLPVLLRQWHPVRLQSRQSKLYHNLTGNDAHAIQQCNFQAWSCLNKGLIPFPPYNWTG